VGCSLSNMTEQQRKDFADYGCASACLIRLSELRKKPIRIDDFVRRFESLFQNGQCGRLTVDKICQIAMGLGCYDGVYAMRNHKMVREIFVDKMDADALVLTDLALDRRSGEYRDKFHCRLALDWRDSRTEGAPEILLFSPFQDSEPEDLWTSLADLEKELVHFLVLS
jgi:hypothetical protein